jgi:hypothetical protein
VHLAGPRLISDDDLVRCLPAGKSVVWPAVARSQDLSPDRPGK